MAMYGPRIQMGPMKIRAPPRVILAQANQAVNAVRIETREIARVANE